MSTQNAAFCVFDRRFLYYICRVMVMNFGERLRALIEESGLTQKEIAKRLNIAPSTMGCYVQNTREPDFSMLIRLADFFGVSVDYLLDRRTAHADTAQEDELLRIFRSLSPTQRALYIEQGRAFLKINASETGKPIP